MSALKNVSAADLEYRFKEKIGDHAVSKIRQRAYVINALCSDLADKDATALAHRLMHCSTHKPCKQPFCPMCRHNQQRKFADKMLAAFSHVPASQLRFLTFLHSVHYDAASISSTLVKRVKRSVRNALNVINKNNGTSVQLLGSFEIEAFAANAILSDRKLLSLKPLGLVESSNLPFFLLHFHAVVNLGSLSESKLLSMLKSSAHFPHKYQVLLQHLHSDKSQDKNLETLATYMLKFRLQHSQRLKFEDDQNQMYKRTCYASLYEIPIAKAVVMSVNSCKKFNGLSFSYNV
ncbi:hypothetical protein [Magnetospirillum sp. SS-4]|uniref:hypothetical protein n=1 Tax=Magnetospirillum sp. SS-4 TaxID=2681465 RepID=UPI00137FB9DE|nr:hypothetical protein [Magnetospirillum sp. SS-4]CAA7620384.1 conserved hypothetical protein [Magnetospirillum sp. SS-4]